MTHQLWHRHPHVRTGSELSLGERAADRMRNSFGSWTFIFATCAFLAGWMLINRKHGFDPYPWILLNLILSCFAAMQGAIILLAAKRADATAAELATAHYSETSQIDELIKSNTALTEQVHDLLQQNTTLTEQVAALLGATPSEGTSP